MKKINFKDSMQQIYLLFIFLFCLNKFTYSFYSNLFISNEVNNFKNVILHGTILVIMLLFFMIISALQYRKISKVGTSTNFSFTWIILSLGMINFIDIIYKLSTKNYNLYDYSIVFKVGIILMFISSLKSIIFIKEKNNVEVINYFFINILLYGVILKFGKKFILDLIIRKESILNYFIHKNQNVIFAIFTIIFIGILYVITRKKIGDKNKTFFNTMFLIFIFYYFVKSFTGIYSQIASEFSYNFSSFYILGLGSILFLFYEAQNEDNMYYRYYESLVIFSIIPFIINLTIKALFNLKYIQELFKMSDKLELFNNKIFNENFIFLMISIYGIYVLYNITKDSIISGKISNNYQLLFNAMLLTNIFNTGIFFNEKYYYYNLFEIKLNILFIYFALWAVFFLLIIIFKRSYKDISIYKFFENENKYIQIGLLCILLLAITINKNSIYSNIYDGKNITNYANYRGKSYAKIVEFLSKNNDEINCINFINNGVVSTEKGMYYSVLNNNYSLFNHFYENIYTISNNKYDGKNILEVASLQDERILNEVLTKIDHSAINESVILNVTLRNMENYVKYLVESCKYKINFNYESTIKIDDKDESIDFLCAAAYHGNENLMNYFYENGSTIKKLDNGNDILSFAVKKNQTTFIKKIINEYDFNKKESNAIKSLIEAGQGRDSENFIVQLELLLKNKIGINESNFMAILNNNFPGKKSTIEYFLKNNIDLNYVGKNGENLIYTLLSSKNYDYALIKLIAEKNKKINELELTYLEEAIKNRKYDAAMFFIQNNIGTYEKNSLLNELAKSDNEEINKIFSVLLEKSYISKEDINHKIILNAYVNDNKDIMYYALKNENVDLKYYEKILLNF